MAVWTVCYFVFRVIVFEVWHRGNMVRQMEHFPNSLDLSLIHLVKSPLKVFRERRQSLEGSFCLSHSRDQSELLVVSLTSLSLPISARGTSPTRGQPLCTAVCD